MTLPRQQVDTEAPVSRSRGMAAGPDSVEVSPILSLQRAAGNRAVAALVQTQKTEAQKSGSQLAPAVATSALALANERALLLGTQFRRLDKDLIRSPNPHTRLAAAFLRANPGSEIRSKNVSVIAVDVHTTKMWTDSKDTLLKLYPKYFGASGTLYFVDAYVANHEDEFRYLVEVWGHVAADELAQILDSAVERAWDATKAWFFSWDSEYTGEAPWAVQFIADLNPLTAVAKIYAWLESNKDLYSGEEIKTVGQQVTVTLDILGGLVGISASKVFGAGKKTSQLVEHVIADPEWQRLAKKGFEEVVDSWLDDRINRGIGSGVDTLMGTEPGK